jgi:hypothetical protein
MTQQVETTAKTTIVRETITGAASNNGTMTISPKKTGYASEPPAMYGKAFVGLITYPHGGSDAPGAWTGTIVAEAPVAGTTGLTVLTITTRSTTATQWLPAQQEVGQWIPLTRDWTMTLTGINSGKKVTVELVFQ